MMLLTISTMFCEEYRIIQRSEDGRYYLDNETVILLANYISKLEDLNKNYQLQIANLEDQVRNLKELLEIEKTEKKALQDKVDELESKIKTLSMQNTIWTVVVAIAIGGIVILFLQ